MIWVKFADKWGWNPAEIDSFCSELPCTKTVFETSPWLKCALNKQLHFYREEWAKIPLRQTFCVMCRVFIYGCIFLIFKISWEDVPSFSSDCTLIYSNLKQCDRKGASASKRACTRLCTAPPPCTVKFRRCVYSFVAFFSDANHFLDITEMTRWCQEKLVWLRLKREKHAQGLYVHEYTHTRVCTQMLHCVLLTAAVRSLMWPRAAGHTWKGYTQG